jgi:hypothetical protein
MQKLFTLVPLTLLLAIAGGKKAFSQCSYVSINKLGAESRINIPCDFPVLIASDDLTQDSVTYKRAAIAWNKSHPKLAFVSVLPGPVATNNFIEIPGSVFISFSQNKQASIKRSPYYYKVKL